MCNTTYAGLLRPSNWNLATAFRGNRWGGFVAVFLCVSLVATKAFAAEGKPWPRHTIDNSSRGADGVRLKDVNGDGLPDVATGWEEGGIVRAYLNPGPKKAKQPWPAVTVGEVRSAEDAVFADLDGDGAYDVVSSCEGGTRTIFFHWAPKSADDYLKPDAWKTEPVPATQKRQAWMFALPMDVDGRNGIDLVVGSKGGGATIGWLRSPKDPRDVSAWTFYKLTDAGWIMSLQKHDMDGDGDLDVLASDRKGKTRSILWLENPGAAAKLMRRWKVHRISPSSGEFMFLSVGNLTGNKRADVACAAKGQGVLTGVATGKTGWLWTTYPLPTGCGTAKGTAIGDIDLDGRADVAFSCEHAGGGKSGLRWFSSPRRDETKWTDHEISGPAGIKFDRLELVDLDADGDLDVMTCEERDQLGVVWYENPAK